MSHSNHDAGKGCPGCFDDAISCLDEAKRQVAALQERVKELEAFKTITNDVERGMQARLEASRADLARVRPVVEAAKEVRAGLAVSTESNKVLIRGPEHQEILARISQLIFAVDALHGKEKL